jgi:hypothetical protein
VQVIKRPAPQRFLPIFALIVVASVVGVACGGDDDSNGGDGGNLFQNGGFEDSLVSPCVADTLNCWFSLKEPNFTLSDNAHAGSNSAHLTMRDTAASEQTKVYYLVQEVAGSELPEVLSGEYFVENWVKGTELQYLQFVVILFGGGQNMPPCPGGDACPNYQIRFLLAGIDREPFEIANAKFLFIQETDPAQGQWVHFERNLRQDFQDLWGAVPSGFSKIRVLFEVRYDTKQATEGPLEADVYYDDLYMGPAR